MIILNSTRKIKTTLFYGTAAFAMLTSTAFAQIENATTIADPARLGQLLLEDNDLAELSEKVEIDSAAMQNVPAGAENIRLQLQELQIEGVSAYSGQDIEPIYKDKIGTNISLANIYEIANKLTNKYRNEGYILTQVVIPPQTIEDGIVKLRVVEGFIDQIIIEGEERPSVVKKIREYAENLYDNNILNAKVMERYLLLINDLPGITARSVLSPSRTQTGASDLTIIIDRDIYDATVSVNNYGSRYLGPYQVSFSDSANSWLGFNERMSGQLVISGDKENIDELLFWSGSYEQPISKYGTKIGIVGSMVSTEPGYNLRQFDVKGQSKFLKASISHPFVRSRTTNISGRLSFDLRGVNSKNNLEPTRRDRIRSVRAGATFQFMDRFVGVGVNAIDIELSKGLSIFGASSKGQDNLTRAKGNPEYTKINAQIQRLQRISSNVNLLISGKGQWSATPLLSSEEFGVGGTDIGRGYDSSEITGEDGIAAKFELQWNEPRKVKYIKNYQLTTFFDTGRVWDQDATTSAAKRDSLSSFGFGINADITEKAVANFGVAFPLTRNVDTKESRDPRYYFNITQKF